jgi:hypothetical protein
VKEKLRAMYHLFIKLVEQLLHIYTRTFSYPLPRLKSGTFRSPAPAGTSELSHSGRRSLSWRPGATRSRTL